VIVEGGIVMRDGVLTGARRGDAGGVRAVDSWSDPAVGAGTAAGILDVLPPRSALQAMAAERLSGCGTPTDHLSNPLDVLPPRSALLPTRSDFASPLPSRAALGAAAIVEGLAAEAGTIAVAVPGLVEHRADLVLPLASVGKLLLLVETARQIAAGTREAVEPVDLLDEDYCGGSGLLRGLTARRWTIGDLALLAASVSDNTATNALLRVVGLDQVNDGAAELGLAQTRILDQVREPRTPEHAPTFAVGTARELAGLAGRIGAPASDERQWAGLVLGWLAANTDRGMVPALIPHDPEDDRLPAESPLPAGTPVSWVANKTGTDAGIRSDVGVVVGTWRRVGYAVLTTCEPGQEFTMLQAIRRVGSLVGGYASAAV
jgi:beta-lactamase class A